MTERPDALPAVILAGGLGTRLGALTAETPKPLVDVKGRPFLDWLLTWLSRSGVRDVVVLAGHLGAQVAAFVGDGAPWTMRARVEIEPAPLGTGGALRSAQPLLPDKFLLVYGDSYLPIDYAGLSRAFAAADADAMMVVYRDRDGATGVAANVTLDANRVAVYAKGGDRPQTHIDAGVVALRRGVLADLPPGASSLERDLYPALAAAGRLRAFETTQRFYDIGTPARLEALVRTLGA